MKHKANAVWAWLLGSCISFGSAASLVTAFSQDADLTRLGIFCAVFCAVCALCFSIKRGSLLLILGSGLIMGFALREGTLLSQLAQLIRNISQLYSLGYGWKVLDFGHGAVTPLTMALQLIGAVSGFCVTLSLCRRKGTALGMVLGVLPMLFCFVVTDTAPAQWCVFLVLLPILLWLLTQNARIRDARQGARLTALLLIPVLLFTGVLMYLLSPGNYRIHEQYLQQWLPVFAQSPGEGGVGGGNTKDSINLTLMGPRNPSDRQIMEVTAAAEGKLYLRGQAFDIYDGKSWRITSGGENSDLWPRDLKRLGRIDISLKIERDLLYTPYHRRGGWASQLHNGRLPNTGNESEYWYYMYQPTPATQEITLTAEDEDRYLSLPRQTMEDARQILEENNLLDATAEQIVDFVSKSAEYSLRTFSMGQDEEDFAIWFLTEGETGYCVHFATAAVVLLRAAGIPARYVEGYAFTAEWKVTTQVTESAAHAWVEYVDTYLGWTMLDPTPMEVQIGPVTPTQTEPAQTQPTETEPVESTEESTEVTMPSETQTTRPSGSQVTRPTGGATTPSADPAHGGSEDSDLRQLMPILQALAAVALAIAALWGQYRLRRSLRLRRRSKGNPNARTLACWRELCRNDRLLKQNTPETLRALAEKAKFSQHSITMEELQQLEDHLRLQENRLRLKKWYQRLVMQLLWATP